MTKKNSPPTISYAIQKTLDALDAWMFETGAYSECTRGLPPQAISHAAMELVSHVQSVGDAYYPKKTSRSAWLIVVGQLVRNVGWITMRFTSDEYGDDDTDAPCDVEWDVHSLLHVVDPTHEIPEEIEPAHVVGNLFPHPSDEE